LFAVLLLSKLPCTQPFQTRLGNANLPLVPKPKKKCCSDKPRCKRCPIRMLAEGTLPKGYAVKKRKLVKVAA